MANTIFRIRADANLTLNIFFTGVGGSGTPNPAGYTTTEILPGWYQVIIAEPLQGKFLYHALDGSSALRDNGLAELRDNTDTFYGFEPVGSNGFPDISIGYGGIGPSGQKRRDRSPGSRVALADSFTLTSGTVLAGALGNTTSPDDGYHQISGSTVDFYYEFDLGPNAVASQATIEFFATDLGSEYFIYFYNWDTLTWTLAGKVFGDNNVKVQTEIVSALEANTGTGVNDGKVRLRVTSTNGSVFGIDYLTCSYTRDIAADGSDFSSIPWNPAWDAEVESEVTDALTVYDGSSFTSIPWNSAWDVEVESEVTDAITTYDVATEGNVDLAKDQAAIAASNTQR